MTIIQENVPACHFQTFKKKIFKQTYLHSSKSDSWATRRSSCSPRFCFNFCVSLCPLDVIFLRYIFSLSIFKISCNLLSTKCLSWQVEKCFFMTDASCWERFIHMNFAKHVATTWNTNSNIHNDRDLQFAMSYIAVW